MMSSIKELECNRCEGKGYYNLSANYDDSDSRIECENCHGSGKKEYYMHEYIFTTKHTVLIEADSKEEATKIYENLDDYGDISDVEIKENEDE